MYCAVLCCTVLCCLVLQCTVLYCTALHCTAVLCTTALYGTVRYCGYPLDISIAPAERDGFAPPSVLLTTDRWFRFFARPSPCPPPGSVAALFRFPQTKCSKLSRPAYSPCSLSELKIFVKCVPRLRTNREGLPGYDGVGVFNVDGEPCVATIPDAFVL